MTIKIKKTLSILLVFLFVAILIGSSVNAAENIKNVNGNAVNLTGVWHGDIAGTYYVNQIGSTVVWYGEQAPTNPGFTNVAYGTISGNTINMEWADVPKASSTLNHGNLVVTIVSNTDLVRKSGGALNNGWTRS